MPFQRIVLEVVISKPNTTLNDVGRGSISTARYDHRPVFGVDTSDLELLDTLAACGETAHATFAVARRPIRSIKYIRYICMLVIW
jgi:hypothetical protein